VKILIKKKKEKENVLIDLELINLKNVSLLYFEELRKKTVEVEKKRLVESITQEGVSKNSIAPARTVGDGIGKEEKFESS